MDLDELYEMFPNLYERLLAKARVYRVGAANASYGSHFAQAPTYYYWMRSLKVLPGHCAEVRRSAD